MLVFPHLGVGTLTFQAGDYQLIHCFGMIVPGKGHRTGRLLIVLFWYVGRSYVQIHFALVSYHFRGHSMPSQVPILLSRAPPRGKREDRWQSRSLLHPACRRCTPRYCFVGGTSRSLYGLLIVPGLCQQLSLIILSAAVLPVRVSLAPSGLSRTRTTPSAWQSGLLAWIASVWPLRGSAAQGRLPPRKPGTGCPAAQEHHHRRQPGTGCQPHTNIILSISLARCVQPRKNLTIGVRLARCASRARTAS